MWRRNPFWRRRRCARVRKDGFVKRMLGTAIWPRLLLKALVDFCFPGAGWCTYLRGSAFWDFGGRWGRICGPPRVEIRQFAFLEEVCVNVLDKWITQWMLGWGGAVLTFLTSGSRCGCYVGVGVGRRVACTREIKIACTRERLWEVDRMHTRPRSQLHANRKHLCLGVKSNENRDLWLVVYVTFLSIYLPICLSIYLSNLPICLSIYLSVYLSS